MELIRLEDIEVRVPGPPSRTILSIDSLSVEEEEILVVLGPTGAGKSTLLKVLAMVEKLSRGKIFWKGKEVTLPAPLNLRRQISMAFQEPLLFHGTVFQNVAYGLQIRGIKGNQLKQKVEENLQRFGIEKLAHQSAQKISGGEAQRVALARALIVEPELLLLDEPLASLDLNTKDRLQEELKEILKKTKTTCVYVTHDQNEAFFMADRIAILSEGAVLQIGKPEEVFYSPQSYTVARFLKTENILPGIVLTNNDGLATIQVQDKIVQAITNFPPSREVLVCLRPEDIVLRTDSALPKESTRNCLPGKIMKMESLGAIMKVYLDCGFPLKALITRQSAEDLQLNLEKEVLASFKATACQVIERDEEKDG